MQRKKTLRMFEDTVYAYEFTLAGMELRTLTNNPHIPSGLPNGVIDIELDDSIFPTLIERLAYFEQINDQYTHQKFLTEVQGAIVGNHAKAYMTHWIYPFKAKFHPQMIRAIFNIIGVKKSDVILDPMTGSGTVNVEAKLMGIDSIGIDCLPIAVLASRVKANALTLDFAKDILTTNPPTPKSFESGLKSFMDIPPHNEIDRISNEQVKDFFNLLYFETLSISRLPNKKFDDVWKKMLGFYIQTVERSLSTIEKIGLQLGNVIIKTGDARNLDIDDKSINHIVTSPPYAIAIDYVVRNTEQLRQMGYSTKEIYAKTMGLRGKGDQRINNYYEDLQQSIKEMYRVLKDEGLCVIVIGDTKYNQKTLPTIVRCIDFAEKLGFILEKNIPKISAGRFGLFRTERILVFRKAYA